MPSKTHCFVRRRSFAASFFFTTLPIKLQKQHPTKTAVRSEPCEANFSRHGFGQLFIDPSDPTPDLGELLAEIRFAVAVGIDLREVDEGIRPGIGLVSRFRIRDPHPQGRRVVNDVLDIPALDRDLVGKLHELRSIELASFLLQSRECAPSFVVVHYAREYVRSELVGRIGIPPNHQLLIGRLGRMGSDFHGPLFGLPVPKDKVISLRSRLGFEDRQGLGQRISIVKHGPKVDRKMWRVDLIRCFFGRCIPHFAQRKPLDVHPSVRTDHPCKGRDHVRDPFVRNVQDDHRELVRTDLHAPVEVAGLVQMSIDGRIAPGGNAAARIRHQQGDCMKGLERAQRDPGSVGKSRKFLFEPIIAVAAGPRPDLVEHPWSKLEFLADSVESRRNERLDFL
jgi:hypothetical protein